MKKLLCAMALTLATSPALGFKADHVPTTPDSYMHCGNVWRSEGNKNIDGSAYLLELQVEYNATKTLSSFEVLYHMGSGAVVDREKQYNGNVKWDERTSTLVWEGRSWKYGGITMKGLLRPIPTKSQKNLWRYDETQYRNGNKVGEYTWICEPGSNE